MTKLKLYGIYTLTTQDGVADIEITWLDEYDIEYIFLNDPYRTRLSCSRETFEELLV